MVRSPGHAQPQWTSKSDRPVTKTCGTRNNIRRMREWDTPASTHSHMTPPRRNKWRRVSSKITKPACCQAKTLEVSSRDMSFQDKKVTHWLRLSSPEGFRHFLKGKRHWTQSVRDPALRSCAPANHCIRCGTH